MEIKSTINSRSRGVLDVIYRDIDSLKELQERKVKSVHAFCFYKDKLVLVYAESKGYWAPPGGAVEEGGSIEQAVEREVKEETNMKVISQYLFGYQDSFEPGEIVTQTRSFCLVEPYGDFISDPDREITGIKLIDPKDYKEYFDWGIVGDRIMERAITLYHSGINS